MSWQAPHSPQGSGGRALLAVERLGEQAGDRRLADAAQAREQVGVGDLTGRQGVAQRPHDDVLADEILETLRPPAPGQHLVCAHARPHPRGPWIVICGSRRGYSRSTINRPRSTAATPWRSKEPGGTAAPVAFPLSLLPSGPDEVRGAPSRGTRAPCFPRCPPSGTAVGTLAWHGGEGGIRTRGTVTRTHAFQACSFGHSDTSPRPPRSSDRSVTRRARSVPVEPQLAERVGFEPTDPREGVNGFRDRPVRPLRHLSAPGARVYPRSRNFAKNARQHRSRLLRHAARCGPRPGG